MLKKIVVGIFCFIILAVTGLGVYIYTLDWNKHKAVVAQRFTQITGLKTVIDGNLTVQIFPTPRFSAGLVKFTKGNPRDPLVEVNDISANIEFIPLFSNKFILSAMSLNGATIHLNVNENGEFNWSGANRSGLNKSGNLEVSFNDVRMTNSTVHFENKQTNKSFEIPNISANINAPSLRGPYRASGKFIHNENEITFSGDVINNADTVVKMNMSCASIASKLNIDGTLGATPKGTIIFEGKSLFDTISVMFGKDSISDKYVSPFYISFTYGLENGITKLDNFTAKYGNTVGSGVVNITKGDKIKIDSDFDMLQFDLDVLENIGYDIIESINKKEQTVTSVEGENNENKEDTSIKTEDEKLNLTSRYDFNINIKSDNATYRGADAHKLNLGVNVNDNIIEISRFGVTMPGETVFKTVGKVSLLPEFDYIFKSSMTSKDIKTFASIFGINLTKNASNEHKKSIFSQANADFLISGGKNALKLSVAKGNIDATDFSGNLGYIIGSDKNILLLQTDASMINFDKYLEVSPKGLEEASLEDKLIYQLNLLPIKGDFETDATIKISNAVYNNIPISNLDLKFVASNDLIDIKKMSFDDVGSAKLNLTANIEKPYTAPYVKELVYDIRTNNFPVFASNIGIKPNKKGLFKHKTYASQGALSGSLSDFSLSCVQKFGDIEFSYTGTVKNAKDVFVNGEIELKANNFVSFVNNIGLKYNPNIPATSFTLAGQIVGTNDLFELKQINSHLGTNHITGDIKLDKTEKPKLIANIDFDKFDVNRMFNIDKKPLANFLNNENLFVVQPKFSDEKFDLSYLTKVDFKVHAKSKLLVWNNETYTDVDVNAILNKNVLNISNFEAMYNDSRINFDFILDSNGVTKISGKYNVDNLKLPTLGGNTYKIENATFNSNGTFNSLVTSEKDFFENLNATGKVNISDVTIEGWDLDIIKFELEQRKSADGLENIILNNLKTGKSLFKDVEGKFEFIKGVVTSDDFAWISPVINMGMKFNLNLSDWLFDATFSGYYNNASFSDILKFNMNGSLANPKFNVDLADSIQRIKEIEQLINQEKEGKNKKKAEQLKGKLHTLQSSLKSIRQSIDRISFDFIRFKPVTNNAEVNKIYENNQRELKDVEKEIQKVENSLTATNDEKSLMDMNVVLAMASSKIAYIPKTLEENFVVDSKNIFDDTFSKITWLFNLAQNNNSYYNSLVEVYMAQIDILKTTDAPIEEEKVAKLKEGVDRVANAMNKISHLYEKIRDEYLDIMDSSSVNVMKENNKLAYQSLQNILTYVKQLNNDIVISIDEFRVALDINARDYDQYIVYPPETVNDIDISKPTTKSAEKNNDNLVEEKLSDSKKKDELTLSFNSITSGISSLFNKMKNEKQQSVTNKLEFTGLSTLVKQNNNNKVKKEVVVAENKIVSEPAKVEPIANAIDEAKEEVVVAENKVVSEPAKVELIANAIDEAKDEVVVAENKVVNEPVKVEPIANAVDEAKEEVVVAENKVVSELAKVEPIANAVDEAKEEVVVAENKVVSEPAKVEPIANAIDEAKEEVVVAENEETDFISSVDELNTPITNAIINKTKFALADILSNINKEEKQLLEDIELDNNTDKSLSNDNKNENREQPILVKLKINPVIAMNIGKSDEIVMEDVKVSSNLTKKGGFINNLSTKNGEQEITETKIKEDVKVYENKETPKQKFLSLFANVDDNFSRNIDTDTYGIIAIYDQPQEVIDNNNQYVFASNKKTQFSGNIGKSINLKSSITDNAISNNKYVFPKKSGIKNKFSGNVGKKIALSVK